MLKTVLIQQQYIEKNKTVLWIKIHDIRDKLGVKNMSDLSIRAIKGIYEVKSSTNEQIKRCKT